MAKQRIITALNAVTATTTSDKFYVGDAKRVGILFRRANHTAGSTAFSVKGSLQRLEDGNGGVDAFGYQKGGTGVTMTTLNRLLDNATTTAYVSGKTLSADGDAMVWLDDVAFVNWLEITATETTDGTHSAFIIVETDDESAIR